MQIVSQTVAYFGMGAKTLDKPASGVSTRQQMIEDVAHALVSEEDREHVLDKYLRHASAVENGTTIESNGRHREPETDFLNDIEDHMAWPTGDCERRNRRATILREVARQRVGSGTPLDYSGEILAPLQAAANWFILYRLSSEVRFPAASLGQGTDEARELQAKVIERLIAAKGYDEMRAKEAIIAFSTPHSESL